MQLAKYTGVGSIEIKMREQIEELKEELAYLKSIKRESEKAMRITVLKNKLGLSPAECELIILLVDTYPRPLQLGFLNDSLSNRDHRDRSDKLVDVYLSRIRSAVRGHVNEPVFAKLWGGWRALSQQGVEFFGQMMAHGGTGER